MAGRRQTSKLKAQVVAEVMGAALTTDDDVVPTPAGRFNARSSAR